MYLKVLGLKKFRFFFRARNRTPKTFCLTITAYTTDSHRIFNYQCFFLAYMQKKGPIGTKNIFDSTSYHMQKLSSENLNILCILP